MPRASVDPVHRLVDLYARQLASEGWRSRIARRERAGEFPFSVQNIYRVIAAAIDPFLDAFAELTTQLDLMSPAAQQRLGAPHRVVRYGHLFVFGVLGQQDCVREDRLELLRRVAAPINTALSSTTEVSGSTGGSQAIEALAHVEREEARAMALLAIVLREYADLAFYGQHDHGYQVGRPMPHEGQLVIVRRFHGLPDLPFHEIVVAVRFDPQKALAVDYDPMRGDIAAPPRISSVTAGAVVGDGRTLDLAEAVGMTDTARKRIADLAGRLSRTPTLVGESRVAELFCSELTGLVEYAYADGPDRNVAIQQSIRARLRDLHDRPSLSEPTWTDWYVLRLRDAINAIAACHCIRPTWEEEWK